MTVSFDPEVIYKNAFYAFIREGFLLYKRDIVLFCDILRDEISKNTNEHIYFNFDKYILSSFYDSYFRTFNVIGDNIYLGKSIKEKDIDEINEIYGKGIIKILEDTRQIFKDKLSN